MMNKLFGFSWIRYFICSKSKSGFNRFYLFCDVVDRHFDNFQLDCNQFNLLCDEFNIFQKALIKTCIGSIFAMTSFNLDGRKIALSR